MRNPLPYLQYDAGVSSPGLGPRENHLSRPSFIAALICLATFGVGCHHVATQPVTLTFLDPARILDNNQKWSKYYRDTFISRAR